VKGDLLAVAVLDVAVDAVIGDVELAPDEPLRERCVRPVEDLLEVGVPVQPVSLLCPESLAVRVCFVVERRGGVRLCGELLTWGKRPALGMQIGESLA
jgi:hypothetical protein